MTLRTLKPIRIGVSILVFLLILILFLDFRDPGVPAFADAVLYFQFIPSLMHFLRAAAVGATGFLVVLILTVLFGRVYCSSLCPLGTFQDAVGFVSRRKRKRRGFRYTAPHNVFRYAVGGLAAVALMFGGGIVVNLMDPFSSFGRIAANLFRPLVLTVNNLAAALLEPLGAHALYRVQGAYLAPVAIAVAAVTLIVVVWLSARHGRLYCNTVCPVGALLGLVSKVSAVRIGFDPDACTGCRRCEKVCKAGCIDIPQKAIDVSRCVDCYNCLVVCRDQGLRFENRWRRRRDAAPTAPGRRGFMIGLAMGVAGMAADAAAQTKPVFSRPTTVPVPETPPVSPPGAVGIAHFTSACTACHLCVSACPSRVLVPALFAYGPAGMMQPRLNFNAGHCNYECTVCSDICPSGAILPLGVEEKKLTQIGVAHFIKENCVVHTDLTNCGACSEHCPTKAVHMVPYPNPANKPLVIPEVNPDICVGCGGCEYACPTKPYKAIYVAGNPVHKRAQKPVVEKLDRRVDDKEDFPF